MLNKDKRSMALALAIGDGCIHYLKRSSGLYGALTIDHGIAQADYQAWKAKLLSEIFERDVKLRTGHNGKSVQISVCAKRIRAWRKFCYPNGKKSIPKILKFVRHPELAVAIWLMDDGYVEPSITNKKVYGARFRIFSCDQTLEQQEELIKWFNQHFNIKPHILYSFDRRKNIRYPFLKFNQADSLTLWKLLKPFIWQFKSMQYKFRHIEYIFQNRQL